MFQRGERVVVAVSGGPDSVCLLHLLLELSPQWDLSLRVAHLNHGLRPEADGEEEFVRRLAKDLSLPFSSRKVKVKEMLRRGESLEEGARRIRYEFLKEVAEEVGARKIALGHTADDLVETVLFNIARGSGLEGLRGIPPLRREGEFVFVRPLISIWREEIEAYLKGRGLEYVIDPSNLLPVFSRNKIRLEVMPLLQAINPRAKSAIYRLSILAGEALSLLEEMAEERMKEVLQWEEGRARIKGTSLSQLHPALQREVLRKVVERVKGDLLGIGREEIEGIMRIARGEGKGRSLPGDIEVRRKGEEIVIGRRVAPLPPFELPLKVPGETEIPQLGVAIRAEIVEGRMMVRDREQREVTLDMDCIRGELRVRNWRRGDRMIPLGMEKAKKLHDIFVDCKVPREKRSRIPIVVDEEGILWVVGLRLAERAKVREDTKRVLHLRAFSRSEKAP